MSGELTTQMVDIFKPPFAIEELYQSESLFIFPRTIESVELERCFVVFASPRRLYIGYDNDNLIELANCLLPLEAYWKKEKQLLNNFAKSQHCFIYSCSGFFDQYYNIIP